MKKKLFTAMYITIAMLFATTPASAHVVVKPAEVGVAAYQTFSVSVPNEKDNPTVSIRLLVPDEIKSVTPTVKPGWRIEVKKTGEGDDAKATEIVWSGGSIPAGQRDDFSFSTQAPATETTLKWKAYQTYQKGEVVSWDQEPVQNMSDEDREKMETEGLGPLSQTKVINDLKSSSSDNNQSVSLTNGSAASNLPTILSVLAIILAGAAVAMQIRKK